MAYLVRDTFEYLGEQQIDTLEDFLQFFWQGSFEDFLSLLPSRIDSDNIENIKQLQTKLVSENWDPQTKTYIRIVDFGSPVNYLSNRMAIESLQWATDPQLQPMMTETLDLIKTTEFIG